MTRLAREIADQLGETTMQVRNTLWRSVKVLGVDRARELLERTLAIEAEGGMLTADGSKRRTSGGVFLALVKDAVNAKDRAYIFLAPKRTHATSSEATNTAAQSQGTPSVAPAPPFVWADRLTLWQEIGDQAGEGRTVKVTLIGRPGKAIDKGTFTQISMPVMKQPELPKGLPPLPADVQTEYLVYIAAKQWRKVAEAATDPDDALIIEGFATYDPDIKGMSVFATNTSSKKLQAATRAQKPQG